MTWQILEVEPAHAVCDQCKRHDCGIVDGQHKWVRTGIVDEYGDHIVIGHSCVNAWAENMGIAKEVVTHVQTRPPTEQEVGSWIMNHMMNGQAIPVSEVNNDDRVVLGNNDNPPADTVFEAGQQANQGTPSPETGGSGTKRTRRATVRQQGNVPTGKTKRTRKHAKGAKDSD